MYRILVGVDGSVQSERAVRFAVDLAARVGDAEIVMLNVQEPVEEWQTHGLARDAIHQHREMLARDATTKARAMVEQAGISCRFDWSFGQPAQTIADQARIQNCAVIVMGTHGKGAIESLFLGSVAYKMLHLSTVPVTLVK
jgi:nucleotide-binding universal stress UspA family protein